MGDQSSTLIGHSDGLSTVAKNHLKISHYYLLPLPRINSNLLTDENFQAANRDFQAGEKKIEKKKCLAVSI